MTRILRYILQHDSGVAPCIDHGLVTLATCKPKIRSGTQPGEWVVGCRPSPAPRGVVVWAGRVAQVLDVGDYERAYRGRSDAVYRANASGGFKRLRPDYHPGDEEFRKDTSAPVLIFDEAATWYFGADPQMMPDGLMHLAAGGRGHRVAGVNDGDARALQSWLASIAPPGVHGAPRDILTSIERPSFKCSVR
ncbi:hypothetical protein [Sphingomonas sp. 37zxx]|uniref:Nmad2 family putative nucleotide modification protein n=1 Tax=Sphingomonas sp. 37zxx TaxID=1550073 RepID=UPI0018CD8E59|nr:hypothetical protein [Sphingomonas sp. 37zxx]